jgi:hypothetical protein
MAAPADPIEIARGAISFCYKGRAVIAGAGALDKGLCHDCPRDSFAATAARIRSGRAAGECQRGSARHPSFAARRPQLQSLIAVSENLSFDTAARSVGISQPRQQALHHILQSVCAEPKISLETTSLQIYRTILTATDQLTLMSRFEAKLNDIRSLAQLPFRSPHLRRFDGIATRIGWQPTSIHLEFLELLRAEARGALPGQASRSRTGKSRRRAAGTRVKIQTGVRKTASHVT